MTDAESQFQPETHYELLDTNNGSRRIVSLSQLKELNCAEDLRKHRVRELNSESKEWKKINAITGQTKYVSVAQKEIQANPSRLGSTPRSSSSVISSHIPQEYSVEATRKHVAELRRRINRTNPNYHRPYCENCRKYVSPNVVVESRVDGAMIINTSGPVDAALFDSSSKRVKVCPECGDEVLSHQDRDRLIVSNGPESGCLVILCSIPFFLAAISFSVLWLIH
jgi:hypothetical protein